MTQYGNCRPEREQAQHTGTEEKEERRELFGVRKLTFHVAPWPNMN
jgi:hypothetical protein